MSFITDMQNEVNNFYANYGTPVRLQFFTGSVADADYDDAQSWTKSGTDLWINGHMQEISSDKGSHEAQWLEEGKLLSNDSRLYLAGSVAISGMCIVGVGSPVTQVFKILSAGIDTSPNVSNPFQAAYTKAYIRVLSAGSIIGEQ